MRLCVYMAVSMVFVDRRCKEAEWPLFVAMLFVTHLVLNMRIRMRKYVWNEGH
jgi:hypothetical protein